jgi:hypothetical protein
LCGRQELLGERQVARPPEVLGVQQDEPRRGVDRAVVRRVRDDAGARQLALSDLVQDLARFLIAPVVLDRPLLRREELERVARRPCVDHQQLV